MSEVQYVVSRWGEPTQTFVRREASAVAETGVQVSGLSIKRPRGSDPERPVRWLRPTQVVMGVLRAVAKSPAASAGVLVTVIRRSSVRNTLPQVAAALVGLAWAGHGIARGHMHVHFGWVASTAGWAASRIAGNPYSVALHAFELHTERLLDDFAPVPLRHASFVTCISEVDADLVAARWGLTASVVRMGVPESWIDTPRRTRDGDLIVSVGSLVEKKGHSDLIRAVAASSQPWRLEIVGEGPQRQALLDLADRLGIADRVVLRGRLTEIEVVEALRRATCMVLACRRAEDGDRDGIPVALMEAMALGVPVVTTNLGGIPELVEGAGLLVEPGRVDQLSSALREMEDPEHRVGLSAAGQERVKDGWTVEQSAAKLLRQIEAVE